ncbi:MAG: ABC transporter ATP-binding protein [Planctomycetota bacterium]
MEPPEETWPPLAEPALVARGLRKAYGSKQVLDGVDLEVRPGEILGYVGPNGAGKTTTVRILCGLLDGFQGDVRVAGVQVALEPLEVQRRIGYVPENAHLYESLTAAEHFELVASLRGLDARVAAERSRNLMDAFGLADRLGARLSSYSKGMRQRVLLTSALLADPPVLFLDEPLSGLDVNSTILVKELLQGLAARGTAVLYCSHVMDVVERTCDRIAVLHQGRIAAQGSFEELSAERHGASLESVFTELTGAGDAAERARRVIDGLG